MGRASSLERVGAPVKPRPRDLRALLHGFYGMVDLGPAATPEQAEALAKQLLDAGARMLQLRMKGAAARVLLACAERLAELTRSAEAALCINDRLDLALGIRADAVHLGQQDLPLTAARRIAGDRLWIGISTHSLEQALTALGDGADYLGFGPIFATCSKRNPDPVRGLTELSKVVRRAGLAPVVAIGGITPALAQEVAAAGAWAAAVIAAVNHAPDPVTAGRRVGAAFRAG